MEYVRPGPSGYHGIQCLEKCLCDERNSITGVCSNQTITKGHDQLYQMWKYFILIDKENKTILFKFKTY